MEIEVNYIFHKLCLKYKTGVYINRFNELTDSNYKEEFDIIGNHILNTKFSALAVQRQTGEVIKFDPATGETEHGEQLKVLVPQGIEVVKISHYHPTPYWFKGSSIKSQEDYVAICKKMVLDDEEDDMYFDIYEMNLQFDDIQKDKIYVWNGYESPGRWIELSQIPFEYYGVELTPRELPK